MLVLYLLLILWSPMWMALLMTMLIMVQQLLMAGWLFAEVRLNCLLLKSRNVMARLPVPKLT